MRRVASLLFLVGACSFQTPAGVGARDAAPDSDDALDAPVDTPSIDGTRADWFDPAWRHRVPVTIDNTKLLAGTLNNFPVLVTFPAGIDLGPAAASLRFVSEDNQTVYPYDVDTFASGSPTLVWVALTLTNTGPKPRVWAYYDNPTATAPGNAAATFSNRFLSVHHMGASLTDATGKAHDGTATGTSPTAGQIGLARTFAGADYIELAKENDFDLGTAMYVSCWVKVSAFDTNFEAIITKGDSSWRLARAGGSDHVAWSTTSGTQINDVNGNVSINDGQWHFIAAAIDGSAGTKTLWIDGAVDSSVAYSSQLDQNNFSVRIGMNQEQGPRYWKGQIDEVRTSGGGRDLKWVKAEYTTVTDPAFVQVGAPEAY